MDWLWSKFSPRKEDPVSKLDPGLKDFLQQQQPQKYKTTPPPAPEFVKKPKVEVDFPDTNRIYDERPLPKESLFQDGRYAHLWKTYTPQAAVEKFGLDTTQRIHEDHENRRQLIHKAALENCAVEDELFKNCFHTGDWKQRAYARATMCYQEEKAFNRCYQLQAKFLVALGYMAPGAPSSVEQDERIQMHADKLYHRMLDYEAAVEEAKENDDPIPELKSVFDYSKPAPDAASLKVPHGVEKKMKRSLSEIPPYERELAVAAWRAEVAQSKGMARELTEYMQEHHQNKIERQETLSRIFGPTVAKFIADDTEVPYAGVENMPKK